MNETYRTLKQKYDDINKQILDLHKEQRKIRNLMEQACTHKNLIKVENDGFMTSFEIEEEEEKFKCKDCYRYFSKEQVEEINNEGKN